MKTVINLSTGAVIRQPLTAAEQTEFDRVKVDPNIAIAARVEAREKALEALIEEEGKKGGVAPKDLRDYIALKRP